MCDSTDFPGATPIPINPTAGFLSKLSPTLNALDFTMFLGAQINGIAVLKPAGTRVLLPLISTEIYTTGFRYRPGSDQPTAADSDAFVVRVDDSPLVGVFAP